MIVNKKLLESLRAAFKRYGNEVLGDPDIAIDFLPTQFEEYFELLLTSPSFQSMRITERQNSVWKFLRAASEVNGKDLRSVSRIAMGTETVEVI